MPDPISKRYISANELLEDSYQLAMDIFSSGYEPTRLVGVWRGGTPVAIAVHELLDYLGIKCHHQAIRTVSYTGINQRGNVEVFGLEELAGSLNRSDRLLVVDDVHDTGLSLEQIISQLQALCAEECPQIRAATPWFKPGNNQTSRKPDYFLHETDEWLVFPHELQGLSLKELRDNKPALSRVIDRMVDSGQ